MCVGWVGGWAWGGGGAGRGRGARARRCVAAPSVRAGKEGAHSARSMQPAPRKPAASDAPCRQTSRTCSLKCCTAPGCHEQLPSPAPHLALHRVVQRDHRSLGTQVIPHKRVLDLQTTQQRADRLRGSTGVQLAAAGVEQCRLCRAPNECLALPGQFSTFPARANVCYARPEQPAGNGV